MMFEGYPPQEKELFKIFCCSLVTNVPADARVLKIKHESDVKLINQKVVNLMNSSVIQSPFPEIEEVIKKCLPSPGQIIKCKYRSNIYLFIIGGTKFCEIAKRSHSKNNIYFYFNISTFELQQRCTSGHCHGRNISMSLPKLDWLIMDPWDC